MQQKKYIDIERLKPKNVDGFEVGDYIVVQEKIDGANFSIRYDKEDNSIKSFSRRKILDSENNLRGAWNWSQTLDVELVKSVLGDNLILFMEWLVPHTVVYPKERYYKVYCYDIFDTVAEQYLSQNDVEEKVKALSLIYVPIFYKGKFTSWNDLNKFVGRTELGGEYGEGIVVKNQTKLNNPNTKEPFYVKIVCDKFAEKKSVKKFDNETIEERARLQRITESIVTEARVVKLLHKMVDEGVLSEDWDEHDMGTIAKNIGKEVYYDCLKEELDVVESIGEQFGKFASSISMKLVREILRNKNV